MSPARLSTLLALYALTHPGRPLAEVTVTEFACWCRQQGHLLIPIAWNGSKGMVSRMVNVDWAKKD